MSMNNPCVCGKNKTDRWIESERCVSLCEGNRTTL